ncbi:hypothetical protein VAE308_410001 [Vibrio aestuarianus]|uniref:Uncharacterized protein n=1 Tax=Vibrio aestuarianus TaxID=28171 RepID=A0ABN8TLV6_9VIBR|nr:hypothetical protein VAE063_1350001 [Vibrio aestuarianus]CAH8233322.1 hypothetical protein VAE308_410001 [Vibrio aestuarianus]
MKEANQVEPRKKRQSYSMSDAQAFSEKVNRFVKMIDSRQPKGCDLGMTIKSNVWP